MELGRRGGKLDERMLPRAEYGFIPSKPLCLSLTGLKSMVKDVVRSGWARFQRRLALGFLWEVARNAFDNQRRIRERERVNGYFQDKTCIEVVGIDVVVAPLRFKQKAR